MGIIYTSKSGNTRLKWRELRRGIGRVSGDASTNSLVNLSMARVLTPEYVEDLLAKQGEAAQAQLAEGGEPPGRGSASEEANLSSEPSA